MMMLAGARPHREVHRSTLDNEVPSLVMVSNSLTIMNCRTCSTAAAGLSRSGSSSSETYQLSLFCSCSICARCVRILSGVNMRLTSEINRGSSLAKSGCPGGRTNESYQFLADKVVKGRFEPEA